MTTTRKPKPLPILDQIFATARGAAAVLEELGELDVLKLQADLLGVVRAHTFESLRTDEANGFEGFYLPHLGEPYGQPDPKTIPLLPQVSLPGLRKVELPPVTSPDDARAQAQAAAAGIDLAAESQKERAVDRVQELYLQARDDLASYEEEPAYQARTLRRFMRDLLAELASQTAAQAIARTFDGYFEPAEVDGYPSEAPEAHQAAQDRPGDAPVESSTDQTPVSGRDLGALGEVLVVEPARDNLDQIGRDLADEAAGYDDPLDELETRELYLVGIAKAAGNLFRAWRSDVEGWLSTTVQELREAFEAADHPGDLGDDWLQKVLQTIEEEDQAAGGGSDESSTPGGEEARPRRSPPGRSPDSPGSGGAPGDESDHDALNALLDGDQAGDATRIHELLLEDEDLLAGRPAKIKDLVQVEEKGLARQLGEADPLFRVWREGKGSSPWLIERTDRAETQEPATPEEEKPLAIAPRSAGDDDPEVRARDARIHFDQATDFDRATIDLRRRLPIRGRTIDVDELDLETRDQKLYRELARREGTGFVLRRQARTIQRIDGPRTSKELDR